MSERSQADADSETTKNDKYEALNTAAQYYAELKSQDLQSADHYENVLNGIMAETAQLADDLNIGA